jgi:hypothetical protein
VAGRGLPARVVPIRRSSSACGRSGTHVASAIWSLRSDAAPYSLLAMQQASRTPQLPFLQLPAALPGIEVLTCPTSPHLLGGLSLPMTIPSL